MIHIVLFLTENNAEIMDICVNSIERVKYMTMSKEDTIAKKVDHFVNTEITRRKFLKISGKSMAGFAVASSMLSLFGCTQKQVDEGLVRTWATPTGLLVVNEALCTGCQRCEINCTWVNDEEVSTYNARVKVTRNLMKNDRGGILSEDSWVYFPDTCRQCEDPYCGNACPVDAIYANDNGVKLVDSEKCIGCGACTEACPWKMATVHPTTNVSGKCILCGACVEGCVSGALKNIPWDKVTAESQKMLGEE